MADEANPCVDKEAQLQVRGLQRGQMFGRNLCIQVSWFDAGILCQIVDDLEHRAFGRGKTRFVGLVEKEPNVLARDI